LTSSAGLRHTQSMLELRDIAKAYGKNTVLAKVNATLQSGTVTAVIGANGSGKSTLLKIIWGEIGVDSGSIHLDGHLVNTSSEQWKRTVGAVPDDDALIDGLSIRGHFRLCGQLSGLSQAEIENRTSHLLTLFNLSEAEKTTRSADEASRGNRKRLACALALLAEPTIIVMDEPYSGLDVERSASLSGIIKLLAERGRIVLFSCHEDSVIRAVADRFLLLRDGMAECGPIRDMPIRAAESLAGGEALPWLN